MDIEFNWIPTVIESKRECVYCEDEYDLEYLLPPSPKNKNDNNKPNLQQIIDSNLGLNKDTDFLVIADELTLTFSGKSKKFKSIDVYTNKKLWKRTNNLSIPITKRKGCLVIENFPIDDNRFTLEDSPKFFYSKKENILKICFKEEHPDEYIEIANDLIIGLTGKKIVDIYMTNIKFIKT